jgi:preprotein translocase subunit SecE
MAKARRETLLSSLVSTEIYQWKQGKVLRRSTAGAILLAFVLASQALYHSVLYDNLGTTSATAVYAAIVVVGAWVAFRVINYPMFADFLIDVESEMAKVTWPSWADLQRATVVVLGTMFVFSVLLFGYDIAWQKFLEVAGVLRTSQ